MLLAEVSEHIVETPKRLCQPANVALRLIARGLEAGCGFLPHLPAAVDEFRHGASHLGHDVRQTLFGRLGLPLGGAGQRADFLQAPRTERVERLGLRRDSRQDVRLAPGQVGQGLSPLRQLLLVVPPQPIVDLAPGLDGPLGQRQADLLQLLSPRLQLRQ